jgi:hypothetical protein
VIGDFPAVLNFNQLILKLNRFICDKLPVRPDHSIDALPSVQKRCISDLEGPVEFLERKYLELIGKK